MTNNNKKGFTLVELSIVLVIIGLLIGGILVAQSMIGTAKIQALTRQFGQFDSAVANFGTKFNQLPGDTALMGTAPGNNNGQITDFAGVGCVAGAFYDGELAHFWYDLSQTGLANPNGGGVYTDNSPTANANAVAAGTNIPLAAAGANAGVVPCYAAAAAPIVNAGNYYLVGAFTVANGTTAFTTGKSFTPADALALDTKIDDGSPVAGGVAAIDSATLAATLTAGGAGLCRTAGNVYQTAVTTAVCNLAVRMGISTGVLN